MEDDLGWKTTLGGRLLLVEDNLQLRTTFGGSLHAALRHFFSLGYLITDYDGGYCTMEFVFYFDFDKRSDFKFSNSSGIDSRCSEHYISNDFNVTLEQSYPSFW